jgi:hypothetical protein
MKHLPQAFLSIALSASFFIAATASAQGVLLWNRRAGTESCAEAEAIAAEVERRLGRPWFGAPEVAARRIEADVDRAGEGYALTLRLYDAHGRLLGARVLETPGPDCGVLTAAAVLTISMLIDASERLEAIPEPPAAEASPPRTTRARRVTLDDELLREIRPRRSEQRRAHGSLFAAAVGSLGVLPSPSVHTAFGAWFAPRRGPALELALVAFGGERVHAGGGSAGSTRFSPVYVVFDLCPFGRHRAGFRFDACLGLQAGALIARARGFTGPDGGRNLPLFAPLLRLPFAVSMTRRFELTAALTGGVALLRHQLDFQAQDGSTQFLTRTAADWATLELGLGWKVR